jgi:NAD(P)-dependent dehydrogenase (short-subunit alcohol dehydrogenase family)
VTADVSNEGAVKNYVDETVKAFGRIDGLYNNAGIEGRQAGITEYDVNIFKKVIDINVMACITECVMLFLSCKNKNMAAL